ncbi:MAG: hypothetical protein D6692_00025 [Planctomycetota bacterium]|nr:MAG: hypothetical protein D6692_00025 [Planctomycetota bacterium]
MPCRKCKNAYGAERDSYRRGANPDPTKIYTIATGPPFLKSACAEPRRDKDDHPGRQCAG